MTEIENIAKEILSIIEKSNNKLKDIEDVSILDYLKKQGYTKDISNEILKKIHLIDSKKNDLKQGSVSLATFNKPKKVVAKSEPKQENKKPKKEPRKSVFGQITKIS